MFQDILILRQHPLFHSHCIIYLLIPTSNHNDFVLVSAHGMLYIFWFLHQTTTGESDTSCLLRCISFDSYIKPQHKVRFVPITDGCISFDSYIKPQPWTLPCTADQRCISFDSYIKPQPLLRSWVSVNVVYLLIPTSNHNGGTPVQIEQLLYIFWFLHQTTTEKLPIIFFPCCISFDSYIKPQPPRYARCCRIVVYLLIPTSNHNEAIIVTISQRVVYLLIPTSNHNLLLAISSYLRVVYLLIPTSNHNYGYIIAILQHVVYLLIPTSNHNLKKQTTDTDTVVYLLIPTSNHNSIRQQRSVHWVVYLLIPT